MRTGGWWRARLWLPVVLKTNISSLTNALWRCKIAFDAQRRHRQCSSGSSSGQGLVRDEVVVKIHGVLCGNNTRQNERSPRFSKNISTAETRSQSFKRARSPARAFMRRMRVLEIRVKLGQLFSTAVSNWQGPRMSTRATLIRERKRGSMPNLVSRYAADSNSSGERIAL